MRQANPRSNSSEPTSHCNSDGLRFVTITAVHGLPTGANRDNKVRFAPTFILGVTDAPLCGHGEECLTGDEIPVRIETRRFPLNPLSLEFLPVAADPHAAEV